MTLMDRCQSFAAFSETAFAAARPTARHTGFHTAPAKRAFGRSLPEMSSTPARIGPGGDRPFGAVDPRRRRLTIGQIVLDLELIAKAAICKTGKTSSSAFRCNSSGGRCNALDRLRPGGGVCPHFPHPERNAAALAHRGKMGTDPFRPRSGCQQLAPDSAVVVRAHMVHAYLHDEPASARKVGSLGYMARWTRRRPALAATLLASRVFYTNHLLLLVLKAPGEGARRTIAEFWVPVDERSLRRQGRGVPHRFPITLVSPLSECPGRGC